MDDSAIVCHTVIMETESDPEPILTEDQRRAIEYLSMIGLKPMANQPIPGKDKTVKDFLDFCDKHVTPVFEGLRVGIKQGDPDVDNTIMTLRSMVLHYAGQQEPKMD